jgi:hypothetical protein
VEAVSKHPTTIIGEKELELELELGLARNGPS